MQRANLSLTVVGPEREKREKEKKERANTSVQYEEQAKTDAQVSHASRSRYWLRMRFDFADSMTAIYGEI